MFELQEDYAQEGVISKDVNGACMALPLQRYKLSLNHKRDELRVVGIHFSAMFPCRCPLGSVTITRTASCSKPYPKFVRGSITIAFPVVSV
jgi:hypothetical protein